MLYGIPKYLLNKLQKIQNNAARIVTRTRRRDHVTPVLADLHWLPIEKRIEYKILLTTFKALHGLSPGYIRDLIEPYVPPRSLRSLDLCLLKKPMSRTVSYGDRSYRISAPFLWNKLPISLRQLTELDSFKTELKTHLFKQAYPHNV